MPLRHCRSVHRRRDSCTRFDRERLTAFARGGRPACAASAFTSIRCPAGLAITAIEQDADRAELLKIAHIKALIMIGQRRSIPDRGPLFRAREKIPHFCILYVYQNALVDTKSMR